MIVRHKAKRRGCTQRMSELFTCSTTQKHADAVKHASSHKSYRLGSADLVVGTFLLY